MRRLGWAVVLCVLAALVGAGLTGSSASAQQDEGETPAMVIRTVDGADPDNVRVEFLYLGSRENVANLVLRENGEIVPNTPPVLIEDDRQFGYVLAIDVSGSMETGDAFPRAIAAARAFVENKRPADRVAIVAFATQAQLVTELTDEVDVLLTALDGLGVGGGTALYDAILLSANQFEDSDLVPNIVLLTDGRDKNSVTTSGVVQGRLDDVGALLFTVGLETDELDRDGLAALADGTGGVTRIATGDVDLEGLYLDLQDSFRRQYTTSFSSASARPGANSLRATVGSASTEVNFQPGARLDSIFEVALIPPEEPRGIGALQGAWALWVALMLAVIAVIGVVFTVGSSLGMRRRSLDQVLQPYADGFVAPDEDEESLVTSALLQRAVDATGRFAERRGLLTRVEELLEQANLPLRAGEAFFFYLVSAVLLTVLALVVEGGIGPAIVLVALAVVGPPAVVAYLGARRRKKFDAQLPDMLNLLASTLRAGYSLMQGVEAAAQEVQEPMRRELGRVITESRLGMPLEEALDGVVERMKSRDFEWAVMAIRIQREVGGNLAALLVTVAETMTERERLRRDVATLTAEGKVSAIVLGLLPIGLGGAMYVINPEYIDTLFEDSFGLIMLGASFLLMLVGFLWMSKIIDIEV